MITESMEKYVRYKEPGIVLLQGDCLEILPMFPGHTIDLVFTDPPYGVTICKWDAVIPFESMWSQINRIIKLNGVIALFGREPFSSALRMSNIKIFKYDWVWCKNKPSGALNANRMPMNNHEIISIFYKKQPIFNKILEERECSELSEKRFGYKMTGFANSNTTNNAKQIKAKYNEKLRNPTTVKFFKNVPNYSRLHPTQKPVDLLEYLIKTYTNEGETVLDFTMGSCSTGVACKNLNRKFIGIEIEQKYIDISIQRFKTEVF